MLIHYHMCTSLNSTSFLQPELLAIKDQSEIRRVELDRPNCENYYQRSFWITDYPILCYHAKGQDVKGQDVKDQDVKKREELVMVNLADIKRGQVRI